MIGPRVPWAGSRPAGIPVPNESRAAPAVDCSAKNAALKIKTTPAGANFAIYPGVIAGQNTPPIPRSTPRQRRSHLKTCRGAVTPCILADHEHAGRRGNIPRPTLVRRRSADGRSPVRQTNAERALPGSSGTNADRRHRRGCANQARLPDTRTEPFLFEAKSPAAEIDLRENRQDLEERLLPQSSAEREKIGNYFRARQLRRRSWPADPG